ncbi:MAG: hypothetical protein HOW73_09600 [Polyangiaceae bacterium]|nr:hypothetical protein [Polyangiaceae bacterium]
MQKTEKTSSATQKAFEALAARLAVETGSMFGMSVLKAKGKAFTGIFGDALVFKLTGVTHATALGLKGAALFDPSGAGRPMKEWVVVPKAHAKSWDGFADAAFAYVGSK